MIERLRQEFTDQWVASTLLRIGTWSIGLILLLYIALWLDDTLTLKQVEWQRVQSAVANLRDMEDEAFWDRQLETAQAHNETLLAQVWQVETAGLGKAVVREAINTSASNTMDEIIINQMEFAEPQPLMDGLWSMRGRITATLEGSRVPWDWIATLEAHRPLIIFDRVDIQVGSRRGVSIIIEAQAPLTGLTPVTDQ